MQFGLALTVCIVMFGNLSGAHFNPAVSFAFALFRPSEMPLREFTSFAVAQYIGSTLGIGIVFLFYQGTITQYEDDNGYSRRGEGSVGPLALYWADGMDEGSAVCSELWGTFILTMNIFFLTTKKMKEQFSSGKGVFFPIYIGVILLMLINVIGALTGCGK